MQKIEPKPWGEQEAYNKLSALCARQECCLSDLAVKMTKKGMDNQSIDRILRQLEEEGFVNEERYSRAFVHDKLMFSHWGRNRIRIELRRKGIAHEIFAPALEEINEEDYLQVLRDLLTKYRRHITAPSNHELRNRLIRYAISRGFEVSLAMSIVDHQEEE